MTKRQLLALSLRSANGKQLSICKKYLIVLAALLIISFMPYIANKAADFAESLITGWLQKSDQEDARKWMRDRNGFEKLDPETRRILTAAGIETRYEKREGAINHAPTQNPIAGAAGEGKALDEH